MCTASDALKAVREANEPLPRHAWHDALRQRRAPLVTDTDARAVLLGTAGGSNPKSTRCGYSNAVVVGDAAYIVDCGEGAHRQMWRAGIGMNPNFDRTRPQAQAIFLTHLHGDHIVDLPNFFMGSWPLHPVDVCGPSPVGLPIPAFPPDLEEPLVFPDEPAPGTRAVLDHMLRAFAYNINVRIQDEGRKNPMPSIRVHEIGVRRDGYEPDIDLGVVADPYSEKAAAPEMDPVVIRPQDDNGVTVSAILVQHAPVFPALGYRFDTPKGSVVFSGDTGECANVARLARDADVLVHEVIDIDRLAERIMRLPNGEQLRNHLASSHSSPEQVGTIATKAGVRRLALSHLVPGDFEVPDDEWIARVRTTFDGDIVVGVDLDELALDR
ncbi:MAG TPA: MBL fold metallo-hydrolase [Acidimicrobiales bacterium]|nr:MBL fold metallo-hydrolase [Acidimicrobiales bacterium]